MVKGLTPEQELNELHSIVARILKTQLEGKAIITSEAGEQTEISTASPAVINAAIKFLKDNNITSVPELDQNLDELKDVLAKKTKRGRIYAIDPNKAAGE